MSDSLNNDQREQLLTAYFDDELGLKERAEAEAILADAPEQSQMLDQWRDSRRALQALPRYSLDRGFSKRVLAAIEDASPSTKSTGPNQRLAVETSEKQWRTGLGLIATLAAMVLLTLFVFPRLNKSEMTVGKLEKSVASGVDTPAIVENDSEPVGENSIAKQPVSRLRNSSLSGRNSNGRPVAPLVFPDFAGPRVEQVLWVENKPLAELEAILTNHQIKVVNREDNTQAPAHFVPMSSAQIDAVYVISSADRMKRAINEISSQSCTVKSFPLPVGLVADWNDPARLEVDSAQQLKPMDLSGNANAASEIASLDRWFGLVGDSDPNRPIQFLLLVNRPDASRSTNDSD